MDLFTFIKNALPIVDVVSGYVNLRNSGHYLKSSCPFHRETDASFTVSPDKQIFYCFGCHASGDVIAFIAKVENVSQFEAAKLLIERHNLVVPDTVDQAGVKGLKKNDHEVRDVYTRTCKLVAEWSHQLLLKTPSALLYLHNRGFTDAAIKLFSIGLFPSGINGINSLARDLSSQGVLVKNLLEIGVVAESKAYLYSPFEERIIFPIKDYLGRHCGFGGRIFRDGDQRPKYYNSKESDFFLKGKLLFGLDQARKALQDASKAFLVEGYMDCAAMVQHGYVNTVATLGTACTHDHLKLLSRYVDRLYVLYDGDNAGQKAILRITELCWDVNIDVYVVILPPKEDPASYLLKYGSLDALIEKADTIFSYFIKSVGAHFNTKSLAEKLQAAEKMLEVIIRISDRLKQDLLLQQAALVMELPLITLKQALTDFHVKQLRKAAASEQYGGVADVEVNDELLPEIPETDELEEKILFALIDGIEQDAVFSLERELIPYFSPTVRALIESLSTYIGAKTIDKGLFQRYVATLDPAAGNLISRVSVAYHGVVNHAMLEQLVGLFLKHHWKLIVKDMKQKMFEASQNKDTVRLQELFASFSRLKQKFAGKGLM